MISDGNGFVISIHYSTPIVSVTIHGRNLQELAHLLFKRQVEWIMEYDPRKWPEVPEGESCITGIDIRHAERLSARLGDDPAKKKDPGEAARH